MRYNNDIITSIVDNMNEIDNEEKAIITDNERIQAVKNKMLIVEEIEEKKQQIRELEQDIKKLIVLL